MISLERRRKWNKTELPMEVQQKVNNVGKLGATIPYLQRDVEEVPALAIRYDRV